MRWQFFCNVNSLYLSINWQIFLTEILRHFQKKDSNDTSNQSSYNFGKFYQLQPQKDCQNSAHFKLSRWVILLEQRRTCQANKWRTDDNLAHDGANSSLGGHRLFRSGAWWTEIDRSKAKINTFIDGLGGRAIKFGQQSHVAKFRKMNSEIWRDKVVRYCFIYLVRSLTYMMK